MTSQSISPLLLGLIPLALGACMNAGTAQADPSANISPMGVDLGSSAGHVAAPSAMSSVSAGHDKRPAGEMQMAHEGHVHTQASGTVNAVDAGAHKINISHGPIPDLGWPPMTMDFPVAPSVNLKSVKPGSHVNFTLEKACYPVGKSCRSGGVMVMNRSIIPPRGNRSVTRRRFVQGVAAAGVLGGIGWPLRRALADTHAPLLSGTRFDLEIGASPVNITGRPATATVVNGSLPAPILRWREGDTVTLAVTNRLKEPTSIHWHGVRSPSPMDGVPGLSFPGIAPGETFVYRIPIHQSGTYWYHSHSSFQEQTGLYGPIVIDPAAGYAEAFDRDYVVLLSDWSDDSPETIVSNLKFQSDYYNYGQRTAGTFFQDVAQKGLGATVSDRLEWGRMRMAPTDILDVSGATYTYLINGQPPGANWTALFKPGERVRLRFINGSSMSIFDVRIPGLAMTVVQNDGNDVEPVEVDEFRIGTAETYDVIVQPQADQAFTIFAQAEDRSGYARGTLAPRAGLAAPVPPMDPRPMRTMADMGMAGMMGPGGMSGMKMDDGSMSGMQMDHAAMPGMKMDHNAMPGMKMGGGAGAKLKDSVEVDNVAMMPQEDLQKPGEGLGGPGRRVLTYSDLRALKPGSDPRPPSREITLHLTGNMERFIWGFDGKKFSEAGPIELNRNERVRFVLINDSMMEHPIHLHGLWSELENGQGDYRPYKHTVLVKPGERISYLVTADAPGRWAYHCHLLYHMEMGMFREVRVV